MDKINNIPDRLLGIAVVILLIVGFLLLVYFLKNSSRLNHHMMSSKFMFWFNLLILLICFIPLIAISVGYLENSLDPEKSSSGNFLLIALGLISGTCLYNLTRLSRNE